MKIENREFEVQVPKADGSGIAEKVKVIVPVCWDEEIQDWLMTPEAHEIIDNTKARLIGLLLPDQLRELRERHNCTQKEMGELFQVGEKSWTRWESGKQRPSRSINLLIRALYDKEISINYLFKRAGKPLRDVEAIARMKPFPRFAGGSPSAEMIYCMVESTSVIHIQTKGQVEGAFLKALSNKCFQLPRTEIEASEKPCSLMPAKSKHRFHHENVNLARSYPYVA